MSLTWNEIESEVRRQLDEYTISGTFVLIDTDIEDTASSNFSAEDILDRGLDGMRHIAARVRAHTVPELIVTLNPTNPLTLAPLDNGTDFPFLRLLGSRVYNNSDVAQRRTFSSHFSADQRAPTNQDPAYIYEDYEFYFVFDAGYNTSRDAGQKATCSAQAVTLPMPGGDATFSGSSWSGSAITIPLPEMFKAALIYFIVSSCFFTLRLIDLANSYRQAYYEELAPHLRTMFTEAQLKQTELK